MSDNHYFMEQELCNGVMNDKVVDKLHKKREPKHWNAKHARTESVVVARKGVIARVDVKHAHDPNEPLVDGGYALLEGLSPEERRSLLDQAPPCAVVPLPAADAPAATGSLSFRSRPNGPPRGRVGHKRQRAAAPALAGKKAPSGPLSFDAEDD